MAVACARPSVGKQHGVAVGIACASFVRQGAPSHPGSFADARSPTGQTLCDLETRPPAAG
eukprot:3671941-Alexandrium_andersonii.AAC.1